MGSSHFRQEAYQADAKPISIETYYVPGYAKRISMPLKERATTRFPGSPPFSSTLISLECLRINANYPIVCNRNSFSWIGGGEDA